MAKCCICLKVKGKRKCLAHSGFVCSSCCGTSRDEAKCAGCSFYKPALELRRYEQAPYFGTQQMADSLALQDAGNVIEGAMCGFDKDHDRILKDGFYKDLTERLLDRYAFGDQALSFSDDLAKEGYSFIESAINEDLDEMEPEFIGKILGTVYRSIKRHANGNYGGREYIDFVHGYVGIRAARGVRVLPNPAD